MIQPTPITLTMLMGLPGSGKSTIASNRVWARQQLIENSYPPDVRPLIRVNKDEIRKELTATGWTWSKENEKQVEDIRDSRILNALTAGIDVISDDTNLDIKHRRRLEELAIQCKAQFIVDKCCLSVSLEECIRRDALRIGAGGSEGRKGYVGPEVIRKFAKRYGLFAPQPTFDRVEIAHGVPNAIICDLDGTLALFEHPVTKIRHRSAYDASTCVQDICNTPVRAIIRTFANLVQDQIIYLSGREDCYREQTLAFLGINACPIGQLYMRKTKDHRKDWIVKGELFDAHVRGKYNVRFVLDDRDQVVKFWRSIGLTCFQVAEGAF